MARSLRILIILSLLAGIPIYAVLRADSYLLRYQFKEGNIDKYSIDLTLVASGAASEEGIPSVPIHGGGRNVVKVAKVNPDGSALIVETLENFQFRGKPSSDAPQMSRYKVSPRGDTTQVGESRGSSSLAFGDPSALARLTTYLPEAPVKQGDSWTVTARNPIGGTGTVTATGKFFKMERVDGVDTVRIHQTYTIPLTMNMFAPGTKTVFRSTGKMKIAGAINFDPKAGRVVRTSITGAGVFSLALPGAAKPKPVKGKKQIPVQEPTYKLKVEVISTLLR